MSDDTQHSPNGIDREPRRRELAGLLHELERLETIFATWDDVPQRSIGAYRRTLDELNAEALRRLLRALKSEPAALAALKRAAGDELVYAVLRYHDLVKPSLNERIETALEAVRPMLASHGGDVRLVGVAPPAIEVELVGACDGCAASALTLRAGIAKAVRDACPEISEVVQRKGGDTGSGGGTRFASPFVLDAQGAWRDAGPIAELPDGRVAVVSMDAEAVLLFRRGGAVTCFRNSCAHLGSPLDAGHVEQGVLTCPHHGFRYDLASGECMTVPGVRLHSHAVRVIGRRVEIRLVK
jgi:Fe-S cluster biogenesis protein NfuA/nitrite reductase/ring-hydroxylating ferredoxin subunit